MDKSIHNAAEAATEASVLTAASNLSGSMEALAAGRKRRCQRLEAASGWHYEFMIGETHSSHSGYGPITKCPIESFPIARSPPTQRNLTAGLIFNAGRVSDFGAAGAIKAQGRAQLASQAGPRG